MIPRFLDSLESSKIRRGKNKNSWLYFEKFVSVECQMLILECITKLVADAAGIANNFVDIAMRVTVNPIVNIALFYVVGQFDS